MNDPPVKRPLSIVSACMTQSGTPAFALNEVLVSEDEIANGVHYDLAEANLLKDGYEEPFVHYDETESPSFLHPAVRQHLETSLAQPTFSEGV